MRFFLSIVLLMFFHQLAAVRKALKKSETPIFTLMAQVARK